MRFDGHIAGVGTSGGTRLVLGCWYRTPHGQFADVMVEHADGHRMLLAPDAWTTDFISSTYRFDEIQQTPVVLERTGTTSGSHWELTAGPLSWSFTVGPRARLGHLLRCVPAPIGRSQAMARVTDAVARVTMPGVRTLGTARAGRTEWYAARDLHQLEASRVAWDGEDLGSMADVDPPPAFGFGSTPRRPGLTALTTMVELQHGWHGPAHDHGV